MKKKEIKAIIYIFARAILALVFLVSGLVKAIDSLGTVYKIEDYLKAFGGFCNHLMFLAPVAAYGLIFAELILCGLLCLYDTNKNNCRRSQWAMGLTLAFYAVMTPLTLWIAMTNPVSDCGCFGDAIVLTNWQTFWKNVVLIVLAAIAFGLSFTDLTMEGPESGVAKRSAFSRFLQKCTPAIPSLLGIALICWANIYLPIIDFRPYKVGANIPEQMEIPEDAPQDIYETTLIYADEEGNEQEFTLQNYPKGDSTWTFVDQHSRLIQKGYEAPVHDFEILTADYEDLTYDILESEDPVTLVIMYDMAKADRSKRAEIARLAGEAEILYVVTGSGEEAIEAYGLPEGVQVCTCDPVTLKTIVRANPGVVVIQSGTVIRKYRL